MWLSACESLFHMSRFCRIFTVLLHFLDVFEVNSRQRDDREAYKRLFR